MEFENFLQAVPKIVKVPLPGETSHLKMAPPERKALMEGIDIDSLNPRKAAVLALVYPNAGMATLALIQRNSYKGVHSSQIAFPGGKVELDDASELFAALRETEEEIGVPREHVTHVCALSRVYIPPSNFCVSPFLGYCSNSPIFIPDPREVSSMIEFPIADLLNESNVRLQRMATSYSESIEVPAFSVGQHKVWGATAMMLSELKDVIKSAGLTF